MSKLINLLGFLKRKEPERVTTHDEENTPQSSTLREQNTPDSIQCETDDLLVSLERDPGLHVPMWHYPLEKRDEIRRAYLRLKPYQPVLKKFLFSGPVSHPRSFQASWYKKFPDWLEYSTSKDAAFCLLCYLFADKPNPHTNTFTMTGFNNWKKVNNGKNCAFIVHVGEGPCSAHNKSMMSKIDLLNDRGHIRHAFVVQEEVQIKPNRLRLEASIDAALLLTLQGLPLRGHDESENSENQGTFREVRKAFGRYNVELSKAIEHAKYNSKYTSPIIQKEMLHIIATKVRENIRDEIGDSKFFIIVDEARDEAKREQMTIVLRFVDKYGSIRERFFQLVRVSDTCATTLKRELSLVLTHHKLLVENIRGQGYDGATLVAASREVRPVHQFFSNLSFIINIIVASPKRHDELQASKAKEIETLLCDGELKTGRGANQVCTLKRAGDTRWGSHLYSVRSVLNMFAATVTVLERIMVDKSCTHGQRGDADSALDLLISYDFVFISHLMRELLEITNVLCQALQNKSQDIVNAVKLVSTTKSLIQNLREERWTYFLEEVNLFCQRHNVLVPEMDALFIARKGRARHQQDQFTVEHHYRVNIFYVTIDKQLQELNSRFNETALGLLQLTLALEPGGWT